MNDKLKPQAVPKEILIPFPNHRTIREVDLDLHFSKHFQAWAEEFQNNQENQDD